MEPKNPFSPFLGDTNAAAGSILFKN